MRFKVHTKQNNIHSGEDLMVAHNLPQTLQSISFLEERRQKAGDIDRSWTHQHSTNDKQRMERERQPTD